MQIHTHRQRERERERGNSAYRVNIENEVRLGGKPRQALLSFYPPALTIEPQ